MKIYIVCGTSGEYSDRSEWIVKAFFNKKRAEKLVLDANAEARKNECKWSIDRDDDYYKCVEPLKNKFDKTGNGDHSGWDRPNYYLEETILDKKTGE